MEANSYLHLHQEHRNWLSQIDFWKGEVTFLKGLCQKFPPEHPQVNSYRNKLDHVSRWLENMRHQIDSHENFLKQSWSDLPASLEQTNMEDHQHNRAHMMQFRNAIKDLKDQIYFQLPRQDPQA